MQLHQSEICLIPINHEGACHCDRVAVLRACNGGLRASSRAATVVQPACVLPLPMSSPAPMDGAASAAPSAVDPAAVPAASAVPAAAASAAAAPAPAAAAAAVDAAVAEVVVDEDPVMTEQIKDQATKVRTTASSGRGQGEGTVSQPRPRRRHQPGVRAGRSLSSGGGAVTVLCASRPRRSQSFARNSRNTTNSSNSRVSHHFGKRARSPQ